MRLIYEKLDDNPYKAFCISNGYNGCGKKHKMNIGSCILKSLTKMVSNPMCKGMLLYVNSCCCLVNIELIYLLISYISPQLASESLWLCSKEMWWCSVGHRAGAFYTS